MSLLSTLRAAASYRLPPVLWGRRHPDPINDALLAFGTSLGRPVTFLQIGSNDGLTNDPLHRFVIWHGWRGVAVEPQPHVFDRLQRNYRPWRRVQCLNVAIGEGQGTEDFYCVRGVQPGDPPWIDQIASFDRAHVEKHEEWVPGVLSRIQSIAVPTTTLDALHRTLGEPRFDLLHVDAEGFDELVLLQADVDGMGLCAILFEVAHLAPDAALRLRKHLADHGFVRVAVRDGDELHLR